MTAMCDACLNGDCAGCEMYADLSEMEDGAVADYWQGVCCCSVGETPKLESEATHDTRLEGSDG